MEDKQKIDDKTVGILKKNMINNVFNLMTQKQRKGCFEFIAKHYDLETGKEIDNGNSM